ncbi:PaaX family transcriptional regulator C-terminal domain-containing protein [Streptomyces sp. CNQ-509]|uniref:PaaX family transcriptional regulator C-terminal domain-containing protein n=1 Tax=Streptomyces sp. CNQ-509 TaxID=444103 RepID=UPI001C1E0E71|nr:PaaX family transcriptional regulator C-terminal domain-containing protein [Streptomyces sp. CNQ-509]
MGLAGYGGRLPPALLPPEWPGVRAQEMFRTLRAELIGPSDELAAAWLATIADAGAQHPSANV